MKSRRMIREKWKSLHKNAKDNHTDKDESNLLDSNSRSINDDTGNEDELNILKKTKRNTLLASRRRRELIEKVPLITNQSLK